MFKTKKEIVLLKKSAKITDSCIKLMEKELKNDITEKQLALAINRNIRKQGAKLAFPTFVACGKRAVYIHANPTNKKIRGLGYADFGAKYKGYHTDITVPFVKGEIGKKEQRILDTTILAYNRLVKSVRTGMYCWKLQEKFEKILKSRGYSVRHSLGHGIGLDIHELPSITMPRKGKKMTPKKRKIWEKMKGIKFDQNMVFTIEPGIYVKGVGGCRIENDFLLTNNGISRITNSRLLKV